MSKLNQLLDKAYNEEILNRDEIIYLLGLEDEEEIDKVNKTACALRSKYFDNKIFLYGFVYFSTWCRNNCAFCYYRSSNNKSNRYRKSDEEIMETARGLAESGVHLIDLTMGEDPIYHNAKNGFESFFRLIKLIKEETGLPIMVSPGLVSDNVLRGLENAGADWYACYQETHNIKLFNSLRLEQDYNERFLSKQKAANAGLLIEEGILVGVGETLEDIATSFSKMSYLKCHQVRVMSFVPQVGSAMENWPAANRRRELNVISVLRLLFPDRLIPASLDIDGLEGLQARLDAGANVVTSIIPPKSGLAGVAQSSKDINEGHRTVQGILPTLDKLGLVPATSQEYIDWVNNERSNLKAKISIAGA